ncbi:MAG: tRNA dihydrouridine synthase DusB [Defluviitaleaceae bacterium]|nr:tRNA dihydrouridine synthase DusB [Defluviitaleaceae bacterium]
MIILGDVKLKNNLIMAPMAGVSDRAFRMITAEHGAALTVSEMVSAKSIVYENKNTHELLKNDSTLHPWAVQFFGREPHIISEAIKRLESLSFEIVDINMGCPMPKIVKNGEGSALMAEPPLAAKIIEAAVKASPRPVTVKIRKGFAAKQNAVEIAKIAQESGAAAIAVHGRTREQYYTGEADWQTIAAVKSAVKISVIGNGDIFTPEIAVKRLQESGCDGLMLARGVLGNPWLFSRTLGLMETGVVPPPPTQEQILAMAIRHLHMAENFIEMRKHLCWYTKGMYGSAEARHGIVNARSKAEMEEILRKIQNKVM